MKIHCDRSSDAAVRQKAPDPSGSPGEPHRTASGCLTGGTAPPCASLLAGTLLRAITAVAGKGS